MAESKRPSKHSSSSGNNRSNKPPPPPPRRQNSSGGGRERSKRDLNVIDGGTTKSMTGNTMVSKSTVRSSRTRESSHTNRSSRSKSRPKESSKKESSPRNSRSRSKSRPKEAAPRESREMSRPRDKSRSRSKSRPRNSPKSSPKPSSSRPQAQDGRRPSPTKQQSKKSNKPKSSSTKSRSAKKNGARSAGPKKPPSAKKREKFSNNAHKTIPASVRMISGSHDSQTSADVGNISSQFQLPNPAGRSGGACTAALLQVLYQSHEYGMDDICWVDVLRQMRDVLKEKGFEQIPQLTSSRMIDVHDPFVITPTDGSFNRKSNTQRAVLIGINYQGQSGELSGCHNDCHNVAKYLTEVQGFRKENVTILMDDGAHKSPTRANIMNAYKRLVKESKEGDVAFCHYSGHGGRLPDDNGDEEDGYDETLIPVDYNKVGQIRDDDLLKILVHPMTAGVTMTCLMDCCHSGTVLDLPYRFTADGDVEDMEMNERCNFKDGLWTGAGIAVGMAVGSAVASAVAPAPEMMILGGGPNAIHEYSDTDCCVVS